MMRELHFIQMWFALNLTYLPVILFLTLYSHMLHFVTIMLPISYFAITLTSFLSKTQLTKDQTRLSKKNTLPFWFVGIDPSPYFWWVLDIWELRVWFSFTLIWSIYLILGRFLKRRVFKKKKKNCSNLVFYSTQTFFLQCRVCGPILPWAPTV